MTYCITTQGIMPTAEARHRGIYNPMQAATSNKFPSLETAANVAPLWFGYADLAAAYQKSGPKAVKFDEAQMELNTLRAQNKTLQKQLSDLSESRAAKARLKALHYQEDLCPPSLYSGRG
jgi:hypothetical protein